jgi:deoxyribose-phosphate aldolase
MNDFEFGKKIIVSTLETESTHNRVKKIIEKCKKYNFYGVFVNLGYISFAKKLLKNTDIKIFTVASYPNGGMTTEVKVKQIQYAIEVGADAVYSCLNYNALKSGRLDDVKSDMERMVEASQNSIELIFVPQFGILTNEEKINVCDLSVKAGCRVIKTDAGYPYNTIIEDILMVKRVYGDALGIEASLSPCKKEESNYIINAGARLIHTRNIPSILQ